MPSELTKEELKALWSQAHSIIQCQGLGEPGKCETCGASLKQRIEVAPTGPQGKKELWAITYDCPKCERVTRVWETS